LYESNDNNSTLTVGAEGGDTFIGEIHFSLATEGNVTQVRLERAGLEETGDQVFWDTIKEKQLSFNDYYKFITRVLYQNSANGYGDGSKNLADFRAVDKRRG